jgi:hypothetical protein
MSDIRVVGAAGRPEGEVLILINSKQLDTVEA